MSLHKYTEETKVLIKANMELLLLDGSIITIDSKEIVNMTALVLMGHILQRDLCNELMEQLENEFFQKEDAIGIMNQYFITNIVSNNLNANRLILNGDEFIPELRGLHGIKY